VAQQYVLSSGLLREYGRMRERALTGTQVGQHIAVTNFY